MNSPLDSKALCQQWILSNEGDFGPNLVYRPVTFSFAPSRGRSGLEFREDGTFKRVAVGPTDVSTVTQGIWQLIDPQQGRIRVTIDNAAEDLTVHSLHSDRLEIAKQQ